MFACLKIVLNKGIHLTRYHLSVAGSGEGPLPPLLLAIMIDKRDHDSAVAERKSGGEGGVAITTIAKVV